MSAVWLFRRRGAMIFHECVASHFAGCKSMHPQLMSKCEQTCSCAAIQVVDTILAGDPLKYFNEERNFTLSVTAREPSLALKRTRTRHIRPPDSLSRYPAEYSRSLLWHHRQERTTFILPTTYVERCKSFFDCPNVESLLADQKFSLSSPCLLQQGRHSP